MSVKITKKLKELFALLEKYPIMARIELVARARYIYSDEESLIKVINKYCALGLLEIERDNLGTAKRIRLNRAGKSFAESFAQPAPVNNNPKQPCGWQISKCLHAESCYLRWHCDAAGI